MSLVRATRKIIGSSGAIRVLILCFAVAGLLCARSVPPTIPHALCHSNVVSQADHGHKQYFDQEGLQWANRPNTPLAVPPVVVSFQACAPSETFVETVTNGLHYNRPPPLT